MKRLRAYVDDEGRLVLYWRRPGDDPSTVRRSIGRPGLVLQIDRGRAPTYVSVGDILTDEPVEGCNYLLAFAQRSERAEEEASS